MTPPRKRNQENRGLPTRWRHRYGAYYYQVPPGLEMLWDGKKEFLLGRSLQHAYKTWSERLELQTEAKTISQLLDQYSAQVLPTKSWKSQESNQISIRRLRLVFGEMLINAIEPHHVYKYVTMVSEKHGLHSARRDWEVLRHVYTKAVEWGLLKAHPLIGQVRLEKPKPRDRYVTDTELTAALEHANPLISAYIEFKLLTGLRRKDILLLRRDHLHEDGIHVRPTKTAKSSGKKLIIQWSPDLEAAVEAAFSIPRKVGSLYLFPNQSGKCYVDEETGRANGFDSIWNRFMMKIVDSGIERFQERDLRAKSASDDTDLESARRRLGHTKEQITRSVYRRKGEVVQPLKRPKSKN